MDNRSSLSIKLDALQRLLMINTLSGVLPLYVMTEYPKSGGSWLSQMLSEYLDVPFPRNERPKFKSSVMHGHMLYTPFMKNVICLYRDGRDVMVSRYYYTLFENDKNSPILVKNARNDLLFDNYEDVHTNLGAFIRYVYDKESASISPYKFTWNEFVNSWKGKKVISVKYEDLINDCVGAMTNVIQALTGEEVDAAKLQVVVKKYSFENQTKRKPGQEEIRSFIRKGKPGDWKEKFTKNSADIFHSYYGKEMIELGYVEDDSWVDFFN